MSFLFRVSQVEIDPWLYKPEHIWKLFLIQHGIPVFINPSNYRYQVIISAQMPIWLKKHFQIRMRDEPWVLWINRFKGDQRGEVFKGFKLISYPVQ